LPEAETDQQAEPVSKLRRVLNAVDYAIIWFFWGHEQRTPPEVTAEDLLKEIKSHNEAFVVFETEAARDAAINAVKRMPNGIEVDGGNVRLVKANYEPDSVCWDNFGYTNAVFAMRFVAALLMILLGLLIWAAVVYVPYAYYFTSYPYSNGDEPAISIQIFFMVFVVIGMEFLNAEIAIVVDWIGFRLTDSAETCFLVLYFSACFISVIMDLVISCFMVYRQLEQGNATTHSGRLVSDLGSWVTVLESYPMQRALGMELFFFAFPACFIVPFIMEPLVTDAREILREIETRYGHCHS
jgi:hypothetical protein